MSRGERHSGGQRRPRFASCRIIALVLMVLGAGAAVACPLRLPVTSVEIGDARLDLEIAATPAARACGLSRRSDLAPDRGMVFVSPEARVLSFWMQDTTLPLSIAFLDADGRIVSIQRMTPNQTEERYPSPEPVRHAIEVNQGWFAQHGVRVGDVVDLRLPVVLRIE